MLRQLMRDHSPQLLTILHPAIDVPTSSANAAAGTDPDCSGLMLDRSQGLGFTESHQSPFLNKLFRQPRSAGFVLLIWYSGGCSSRPSSRNFAPSPFLDNFRVANYAEVGSLATIRVCNIGGIERGELTVLRR